MIVRRGKQYVLYTHDGSRVLGKHPSRAAALRQERAIYAAKARRARRNPAFDTLGESIDAVPGGLLLTWRMTRTQQLVMLYQQNGAFEFIVHEYGARDGIRVRSLVRGQVDPKSGVAQIDTRRSRNFSLADAVAAQEMLSRINQLIAD